jgi:phytoene dehydrogenase-like protein
MSELEDQYDAIVIGAGMSGLAAAIRLAMYDKKVCLLERHRISGGLNSYYNRGKRRLDVGLHALTNFMEKGERAKPMAKLLKQLRLPYESLELAPQTQSSIVFPDKRLSFTNSIDHLIEEVHRAFPEDIDGFRALIEKVKSFDEVNLDNEFLPARSVVQHFIKNELLLDMIFCPLLIYGSALEDEMDFSQFVIMFKSIYLEGFARPEGGVRRILTLLEDKLKALNTPIHFGVGVESIQTHNDKVTGVTLMSGQTVRAPLVFSSMGLGETLNRVERPSPQGPLVHQTPIGKLSFTETVLFTPQKPRELGFDDTIIFYNNRPRYHYRRPEELVDFESAVICFPNNFSRDDQNEGIIRLTHIANYDRWRALERAEYLKQKEEVLKADLKLLETLKGPVQVAFKDVFSPTTVERYTWHYGGAVYGSPLKTRRGLTPIENLIIIGTDQGFLGIVGAMLSGISLANLYGLQDGQQGTN